MNETTTANRSAAEARSATVWLTDGWLESCRLAERMRAP